MFAKLRGLWSRIRGRTNEPLDEQEEGSSNPFILISMTPDGKLNQSCYFPVFAGGDGLKVAENFATMLFLLNDGRLLPTLQKAVAVGGMTGDAQEGFAHVVLEKLNRMTVEVAKVRDGAGNKPVVRGRDVFGFNTRNLMLAGPPARRCGGPPARSA